ncbi:MAG: hypothetical protein PHI66_01920 [Candidatus Pacebacteria bacterium]|nr:hypothetical protein [Candidatus Paceibacterota bacterium]
MIPFIRITKARGVIAVFFVVLSFSVFSPLCQAATDCNTIADPDKKSLCQLKRNTTVNVTTVDHNWYDPTDAALHDFAVCDLPADITDCPSPQPSTSPSHCSYSNYTYTYPTYCNDPDIASPKHTLHREFYSSDDLDDETNINRLDKNFKIEVTTSSNVYSGINSIQIQWKSTTGVWPPASWTDVDPLKAGSVTCWNTDSCSICRESGNCDNPTIPVSALSTNSDGTQNVLWIRAIITDNNFNVMWIGEDEDVTKTPVLDKYYRFPICSDAGCANSCLDASENPLNEAPEIQAAGFVNNCALDESFTLNWSFTDNENNGQSEFYLEVYNKDTNEGVYSTTQLSNILSWSAPELKLQSAGGVLVSGQDYGWRLRIRDDYSVNTRCRQWSDWFEGDVFTACSSCAGNVNAPSLSDLSVTAPINFCAPSLSYVLSWITTSDDGQGSVEINLWNVSDGTGPISYIYDDDRQSFSAFLPGDLEYGKTYRWELEVWDDYFDLACRKKIWVDGGSFTVEDRHPTVNFSVYDSEGTNCLEEACNFLDTLDFIDESDVSYFAGGSLATYEWGIEGSVFSSEQDTSRVFAISEGGSHNITLTVDDGNGCVCSKNETLLLGVGSPVWTEIAPGSGTE